MIVFIRRLGMRALVTTMLIVGITGNSLGLNLGGTPWLWAVALGVGLFASTYGIDLEAMRASDWRVVVLAVTVGVFVKAAIISLSLFGVSLWLIGGSLIFFVLGTNVAQMDPLAIAALAEGRRMSKRVDNLVRAVSSLDDPVTVLMTILLVMSQQVFGFSLGASITNVEINNAADYGAYLWLNIAFMTSMVWFWQLAYRGSVRWKLVFTFALVASSIVIGASWYWMFGLALMGIYLRPDGIVHDKLNTILDWATKIAFAASGIVAGSLLFETSRSSDFTPQVLWGLGLGIMAFVSQMIAGWIMTMRGGYTKQDRWYFACSHQNGLTATMLGVATGTIAYVVPAIVVTHVLHAISMTILNRRFDPVAEEGSTTI